MKIYKIKINYSGSSGEKESSYISYENKFNCGNILENKEWLKGRENFIFQFLIVNFLNFSIFSYSEKCFKKGVKIERINKI